MYHELFSMPYQQNLHSLKNSPDGGALLCKAAAEGHGLNPLVGHQSHQHHNHIGLGHLQGGVQLSA